MFSRLIALLLLISPALADEIDTNLPDNTSGLITPQVLRNTLHAMQDGTFDAGMNGVKCDGVTDDTAAWTALIAAVPNDAGATVRLPSGCTSLVTSISLNGKSSIRFIGSTATQGGIAVAQPIIRYNGAAGGTLMTCTPCADIYFEGITFDLNNLADNGFQAVWSGTPFVTQYVRFNRVGFYAAGNGGSGRTNAKLIDWCSTGTTSNCEQLDVRTSFFGGSGTASNSICVDIGHGNAVADRVVGSSFSQCGIGVKTFADSYIGSNIMESGGIDIRCIAAEPVEVADNRFENGKQALVSQCVNLNFHDNRIAKDNTLGQACSIDLGNSQTTQVFFINNQFNLSDTVPAFCSGTTALVQSQGNIYPTASLSGTRITALAGTGHYLSFWDQPNVEIEFNPGLIPNGVIFRQDLSPINGNAPAGLTGIGISTNGATSASGVVGQINGSASGAAVRGTSTGLGNAGLIAEADMVAADFSNSAMVGNGTTAIGFHAITPGGTVGTWTNIYGIKIDKMCNAGISNCWGVYQADSGDANLLNGPVTFGSTNTFASSTTGAVTQTFTNAPCTTSATTERWIPVQITGQTGTWYVPACH